MSISESFDPTPKRRGKKGASKSPRKAKEAAPLPVQSEIDVEIADPTETSVIVDPATGAIEIPFDDGSVLVDFTPESNVEEGPSHHDDNLAMKIDDGILNGIAEELLEGIAADDESRSPWMDARAKGIDLLGLKLEDPKSGVGSSSAPLEGMSVVRDPVMLEAVLRFQANAQGEMLPAAGPVKAVNYSVGDTKNDKLAEALEKDLNYYLTTTATEYYPDSRRMYFWTGFSGLAFKKVYRCPMRRRPVSESVDASDLIVEDAITDLRNAGRITHQINMRRSVMKRMQIMGVYRDIELTQPNPEPNAIDQKVAKVQGVAVMPQRPQDQNYTIYECYCELDLPGFEHKHKGKASGLPLPYRVTIDKDSRQILEIRRNWAENDTDYLAKIPFVAFPYATGLGFYGIGLLHILGNLTSALTALTRESIDAGMFANFPGFLVAKDAQRQQTNEFRIPPGGGLPIETGGRDIRQMVMALPYKSPDAAMMQLMSQLREVAQRVGGTADTPVGEGKQDAPVGTTLALIEQATKIEGAVHKALHAAQAEEFKLLVDLFLDDPEALFRGNKRCALGNGKTEADKQARIELFKQALENCEIVPKADPNVPSHMHRVMKATAIKQMAAASPELYNKTAVDTRILAMINVDRPEELFIPPQPPAPNPEVLIKAEEVKVKAMAEENKKAKIVLDTQNKAKDRESRQNIEVLRLASSLAVHPESDATVDQQLVDLSPLLTPKPAPPPPQPMRARSPMGLGGMMIPPSRFSTPAQFSMQGMR